MREFDLSTQLGTVVDQYRAWGLEDRQDWDPSILHKQVKGFVTTFLASAESLKMEEDLETTLPLNFWHEWREQYDLETATKRGQESLEETMRRIRMELQSCRDATGRANFQKALEVLQGFAALQAQEEFMNPPTEKHGVLRLVWEWIEVDLAYEFVDELLDSAATRVLHLWGLLAQKVPSDRCLDFLRRVSRCYIWGFHAECIIMCRAAIEAAFEAEIPTDDCIDILGADRRPHRDGRPVYDLYDRIQVALAKEYIDKDIEARANRVRELGNKIAHRKPLPPQSPRGPYEVISDTMDVLKALCDRT